MKAIIELRDVKKSYFLGKIKVEALRKINLTVKPKDFIAIMGPSGSGKSTLVNLIGCLDIPDSGYIFLKGKDITKLGENELANLRGKTIGFVFQQFNLIPTLTALDNVILPMAFQGVNLKKARRWSKKLLKMVGLADRIYHKPSELSGGEQQRVAIARALSNNPEIILADEPTGNLDSKSGKQIIDLLVEFNKKGKTIIMVTHDKNIAKYAKTKKHLKDGRFIN